MFGSFGTAVQIVGVLMVLAGAALLGVVVAKSEQLCEVGIDGSSARSTQQLAGAATALCGGGTVLLLTSLA